MLWTVPAVVPDCEKRLMSLMLYLRGKLGFTELCLRLGGYLSFLEI